MTVNKCYCDLCGKEIDLTEDYFFYSTRSPLRMASIENTGEICSACYKEFKKKIDSTNAKLKKAGKI